MFIPFIRANARWLGTGLLLTLVSSFGQTYFISIFADRIMADYSLSDGEWGGIYTVATLSSAAALLFAGKLADQITVGRLAVVILIAYAAVAVGMALNESPVLLVVLIFGLRFCGQGMSSHIAMTAMGRWFRAHRGRAVVIAGLGFSLGEALLPNIAAALEPAIGWRMVWLIVAVLLVAVFAPFIAWLARSERSPQGVEAATQHPGRDGRHWTRGDVMRHPLFWAMVPGVIAQSFIGTVLFFQIANTAAVMGWSKIAMTTAYPVYAVVTVVVSLFAGVLVDRVGPDRLLPVVLVPLGIGMAMIGPFPGIWSWWLALSLAGISTGIAHALWGALWPELYGTRHLGAIKAVAYALMVVGSAIGPGVTGFVIDLGVPFPDQTFAMMMAALMISLLQIWVLVRLPPRMAMA